MFVLAALILAVSVVNVHSQDIAKPKRPQIAFTVNNPTGKLVGTSPTFSYNYLNIGGGYNPKTAKFTAPVCGLYLFSATIVAASNRDGRRPVYCLIMKTYLKKRRWSNPTIANTTIASVYNYEGREDSASVFVFDHLLVGESVALWCHQWDYVMKYGQTSFTGALIMAD